MLAPQWSDNLLYHELPLNVEEGGIRPVGPASSIFGHRNMDPPQEGWGGRHERPRSGWFIAKSFDQIGPLLWLMIVGCTSIDLRFPNPGSKSLDPLSPSFPIPAHAQCSSPYILLSTVIMSRVLWLTNSK